MEYATIDYLDFRFRNSPWICVTCSGAGTNLKWGGGPVRRKAPKKFFWLSPPLFLALKVQLVVLVSAFSTIWSVSCLLSFYSGCTHVPSHF